jgi:hypothetical protein
MFDVDNAVRRHDNFAIIETIAEMQYKTKSFRCRMTQCCTVVEGPFSRNSTQVASEKRRKRTSWLVRNENADKKGRSSCVMALKPHFS